jgi:predicted ABC-type ATPase
MKTFKQFMQESINDRGRLKAIFVIGLPGSGKSYTIKQLTGSVAPRIVNTDNATEYFSKKFSTQINSANWDEFKDDAHRITHAALLNYVDGLLPLFVDGTSNDVSNILHRMGILESIGYDVGVVFVNTPLQTALKRAKARAKDVGREIDEDFIREVDGRNAENAAYLRDKVSFFKQVNNSDDELDDLIMHTAFKAVQSFYDQPVKNPVGRRTLEEMNEKKLKYIAPEIMSRDVLAKKINGWYRS